MSNNFNPKKFQFISKFKNLNFSRISCKTILNCNSLLKNKLNYSFKTLFYYDSPLMSWSRFFIVNTYSVCVILSYISANNWNSIPKTVHYHKRLLEKEPIRKKKQKNGVVRKWCNESTIKTISSKTLTSSYHIDAIRRAKLARWSRVNALWLALEVSITLSKIGRIFRG